MSTPTNAPVNAAWTTCELDGHRLEAFLPPPEAGRPPGAILHLRDIDDLPPSQVPAWQRACEASPLPVVSLAGGTTWWLDRVIGRFDSRLSPEAFILGPLTGWLRERFELPTAAVAVVGQGSGGQGALRLAYRHPAIFPVAAAINPAIDFHLGMRHGHDWDDGELFDTLWEIFPDVEQARQETAILHVHPLNWPRHQWFTSDPADLRWRDGAERLHSKLVALGIPHTALLDPAAGDVLAAMSDAAVAFVLQALESESRRVV